MNLKNTIRGIVLFVFAFSMNASAFAVSGPFEECVIPKLDGERVPFPLKNANTKFDLAENETYILNGTIVEQDGKSYFKVDFETQPWLASQKRIQFPYFPIESVDLATVKKFSGNLIQIAVVVRKKESISSGKEFESSLVLDLISIPVLL